VLGCNGIDPREALLLRDAEDVLVVCVDGIGPREPRREDERQPGPLEPVLREVEAVLEARLDGERGVADDERAGATLHRGDGLLGIRREEVRGELAPREEQARQDHARARREVERDGVELVQRTLRDDGHAANLAARADRHVAEQAQLADGRSGRDGEEPDVGLVLGEGARERARASEIEIDARVVLERLPQRSRIEVRDAQRAKLLVRARVRAHDGPSLPWIGPCAPWMTGSTRGRARSRSMGLSAASGTAARGSSRTTL
jgi:hypothetical protein